MKPPLRETALRTGTLTPILQQLKIDPGKPTVMPMHKVIVPAAKKASPKKRAKAAARR